MAEVCLPCVLVVLYKISVVCSAKPQASPALVLAPMVPSNPAVHLHLTPPEGFTEYLALLLQNGSLPPLSAAQPASPSALSPTPRVPLPTKGRTFSRAGRGTGGVLVEKQKVSRQITAPATKRKSLVDPELETELPLVSDVAESVSVRPAKRARSTKVSGSPLSSSMDADDTAIQSNGGQRSPKSQGSARATPAPPPPELLPNPVSSDCNLSWHLFGNKHNTHRSQPPLSQLLCILYHDQSHVPKYPLLPVSSVCTISRIAWSTGLIILIS